MTALKTIRPTTVDDFYGLIFRKVRHVLLDMARQHGRHAERRQLDLPNAGCSDRDLSYDPSDTTYEPSHLAFWTEFHQEVGNLPDDQRAVFDFHYFAEFPQAEIARLLDMHPKAGQPVVDRRDGNACRATGRNRRATLIDGS